MMFGREDMEHAQKEHEASLLREIRRLEEENKRLRSALEEAISQLMPFAEDGKQPSISAAIDAGRSALTRRLSKPD